MNKRYINLFKEIAKATAISAEQVMDYDKEKKDEEGYKTAEIMRDDFNNLLERITAAGEDYKVDKADCAKLAIGAFVIAEQLEGQISLRRKAIEGYRNDLIPKLQKLLDTSDESFDELMEKSFSIEEEPNT